MCLGSIHSSAQSVHNTNTNPKRQYNFFNTNTNSETQSVFQQLFGNGYYQNNQMSDYSNGYYNNSQTSYSWDCSSGVCRPAIASSTSCENKTAVSFSETSGNNYKLNVVTTQSTQTLPYGKMWIYIKSGSSNVGKYFEMRSEGNPRNNINISGACNANELNRLFTYQMTSNVFSDGNYTIDYCSATCTGGFTAYKLATESINFATKQNKPLPYPVINPITSNHRYTGVKYLNYVCSNPNSIYLRATPNGTCNNYQSTDAEMERIMNMYAKKYNLGNIGSQMMMNKLVQDRIIYKSNNLWAINFDMMYQYAESVDWIVPTY
jgi:hypothetical protein